MEVKRVELYNKVKEVFTNGYFWFGGVIGFALGVMHHYYGF